MKILYISCLIMWFISVKSQTEIPFDYEREWGTYLGGGYTYIEDSTLDFEGNLWLVGRTNNPTIFNTFITSNAHQAIFGGNTDGILVKISPQGSILYASYYGGSNFDNVKCISIDISNNIYIGGATNSFTNIATTGAYQSTYNNNPSENLSSESDAFIVKFNNLGQRIWGTYYGGNRDNSISKIISDSNGSLYIYGSSKSNNLASPNAYKTSIPDPSYLLTLPDGTDVYFYGRYPVLSKFDSTGNRVWATYYSPDLEHDSNFSITDESIAVDNLGNVYVSGRSGDTLGYYATSNSYQSIMNGSTDIYISKFSSTGSRLWSTYYGGENSERTPKILIDSNNNLYLTGRTKSNSNIATSGTYKSTFSSLPQFDEYFIAKFNSSGIRLWGTYYDQNISNITGTCDIAIDNNENIYFYGTTINQTIINTQLSYQINYGGGVCDAFFAKFNSTGNRLWSSYYGGNNLDQIKNIVVNSNKEFYLTGYTNSTNNMASTGAIQSTHIGQDNETIIFLAKFIPSEPLSIDNNFTNTFIIYPNPSTGDFSINNAFNYEDITIELYDSLGRIVYSNIFNFFSNNQIISPKNKLTQGIYLIQIKNESNQILHTQKLLVQ